MVEEDYHGRGIASRLLRHLADCRARPGIATFEADVLAENAAMRTVFERSGLADEARREGGVVHLALTLPGVAI